MKSQFDRRFLTIEHVRLILDPENPYRVTDADCLEIEAFLQSLAGEVGGLLDRVTNTDPQKGHPSRFGGTPNRNSYTYKLRKAAGFAYP